MSTVSRTFMIVAASVAALYFFVARTTCACSPKYKAYISATKMDLRNLVTAEELRFSRDSTYTTDIDSLEYPSVASVDARSRHVRRVYLKFDASPQVHLQITWAGRTGWKAVGRHDLLQGECAIFVGTVPEPPRVAGVVPNEGQPRCDRHPN